MKGDELFGTLPSMASGSTTSPSFGPPLQDPSPMGANNRNSPDYSSTSCSSFGPGVSGFEGREEGGFEGAGSEAGDGGWGLGRLYEEFCGKVKEDPLVWRTAESALASISYITTTRYVLGNLSHIVI